MCVCVSQKNLIQVWNDMWVSKWQHFHFCLNYSFNIIWQECNPTALICFYPILFQFKMTSVRIVTSYLESVDSMRKLHPENTTNIFTADVNKIWLTLWFTKGACGFFFCHCAWECSQWLYCIQKGLNKEYSRITVWMLHWSS